MSLFELDPSDITLLSDSDLRELVARLCEAELSQQKLKTSCVTWGGAQEAADGGLDVYIKNTETLSNLNFIPCKNTGFQVKKHTMTKSSCKKEMQDNGVIKPIIKMLADLDGAYIIISGKDDCSEKMLSERIEGMSEVAAELPNAPKLTLDFYGRDRISAWLRRHPGVALWARSRLGKTLSGWKPFGHWSNSLTAEHDIFLADEHPCITDTSSNSKEPITTLAGLKITREKLQAFGSAVRITGLSGVGKTRFAQALFEESVGSNPLPMSEVIYGDLGSKVTPSATELASYLIANNLPTYLVLDNCPSNIHREIRKQLSESSSSLRLLTIEYDISDDQPEETKVIHIEPFSETIVSKLVQRRFPEIEHINAEKISQFSGGNARLALALASRVGIDETLSNFTDEDLFNRLFSQRKNTSGELLESSELLSLVYSFNTSNHKPKDELNTLGRIGGIARQTLQRSHAELMRRQLVQQRGDWRAVLPHALANRLAKRALQSLTPDDINQELFQAKNIRLFKSCAHRIGFLHDFAPAQELAKSWIKPGAPLHNLGSCSSELLTVLKYISPVLPETILNAIEIASQDQEFASRNNINFRTYVRLLCQLAYWNDTFDRAANVLLKFAETERQRENADSIAKQLSQLFSLYLSGTEATPTQRQLFISKLINSKAKRHLEIARNLLSSALKTTNWSSFSDFSFGARKMGHGWRPESTDQVTDWYIGFIELLLPPLSSGDIETKQWAMGIFSQNFQQLWLNTNCFDILDKTVTEHARDGKWPDIWTAIKQTIYYCTRKKYSKQFSRLVELETICAPTDLHSEIEAYAFTDIYKHAEIRGKKYEEAAKKIIDKIKSLGESISDDLEYLNRIAPRLLVSRADATLHFGKGIARGTADHIETFELFIKTIITEEIEDLHPVILHGYIETTTQIHPFLANKIYTRILETTELRPFFIYLLGAGKITAWGTEKLLELATGREIEASAYMQLCYGRIHEDIPDKELAKILLALNKLRSGPETTLQILRMRLHSYEQNLSLSSELQSAGRNAILHFLQAQQLETQTPTMHGLEEVLKECLSPCSPHNEIHEIINSLCSALENYFASGYQIEEIISAIVTTFPELVLDRIYRESEKPETLSYAVFLDHLEDKQSLLTSVPIERLISWCNNDQRLISNIAQSICSYITITEGDTKKVTLSDHIRKLLEASNDKSSIIEAAFMSAWPNSWSSSLADILESRSLAFSELLNFPSKDIQDLVKTKLLLLEKSIRTNRQQESEESRMREQRFE